MQIFFSDAIKLTGYLTTSVIVISSNPLVGPLPRTMMSFSYCEHAEVNSYRLPLKIVNVHQIPYHNPYKIQYHNLYIRIYHDQNS